MVRPIAILGAPSAIGIRLYEDGGIRRLDLAPQALRAHGLVARLGAEDLGDVVQPRRYQDLERPTGRPRNEEDVAAYSHALAERVAAASADEKFVLLLGGDCSIVLGALLGLRQTARGPVGLVYIDAHADFASLDESPSGSPCSMALALAVGRCDTPLARLAGDGPLVRAENVVHIGRRDDTAPAYGNAALRASPMLDMPHAAMREKGPPDTARAAIERMSQIDAGFWIHIDADVLDPAIMPAVDTPEPNGLDLDELIELVAPIARHPQALGLQLTIYDPTRDPSLDCAELLATLLESALAVPRHMTDEAGRNDALRSQTNTTPKPPENRHET
jgi:arginase